MKQITIREFQNNVSDFLDDLPIGLTKYGRVVAIVHPPTSSPVSLEVKEQLQKITPPKPKVDATAYGHPNVKLLTRPTFKLCKKHGAPLGLCKRGCTE